MGIFGALFGKKKDQKEGNKKASTSIISTKKEAFHKAQAMVKTGKASSVIVHDKDGKISR